MERAVYTVLSIKKTVGGRAMHKRYGPGENTQPRVDRISNKEKHTNITIKKVKENISEDGEEEEEKTSRCSEIQTHRRLAATERAFNLITLLKQKEKERNDTEEKGNMDEAGAKLLIQDTRKQHARSLSL